MRSVGPRWAAVSFLCAAVLAGCGSTHASLPAVSGKAPPQWAADAAGWPSHNLNLANTRAMLQSRIDAHDVRQLKQRWTFRLPYTGEYGAFTSNPIVAGGVVYLEDPDSDVFALSLATGKQIWSHDFHSATPSGGPNGVALGYGLLFGETADSVFALSPRTGKQVWIRKLTSNANEGIDMAPQLYDGRLLISTIPGERDSLLPRRRLRRPVLARRPHRLRTLERLDREGRLEALGRPEAELRRRALVPAGRRLARALLHGRGQPGSLSAHAERPECAQPAGAEPLHRLARRPERRPGKLLWYRQITPHDIRDHDFQDSPILVDIKVHGRPTEAVIGAGKSGFVVAFRASDGTRLWTLPIGKHNRYQSGPLPARPVLYCPGSLGGVLTPMAEARGLLDVPWIDVCFKGSATGIVGAGKESSGIAAVDTATGAIRWKHIFRAIDSGAATVAGDVVFTSTTDGTIYALSTRTGSVLWHTKAPSGINSFPAVTKTMLIVGTGARTSAKIPPHGEIVAYALPRSA